MKKLMIAALLAATTLVAAPAQAAPILLGQWYTFGFGGTGSSVRAGTGVTLGTNPASLAAPTPEWTFTLPGAGSLIVVDGFASGDQFSFTDGGTLLGVTSVPIAGSNCSSDITNCLASAAQSKGSFALLAGDHSISGTVLVSPFGAGAAFFRVNAAAVPEPGTWAMMIGGFGAVGFALRRQRRSPRATARLA